MSSSKGGSNGDKTMDVKNWLGIIVLTFTLFAGSYGAIKVFATNDRVDLVQLRLDQKIENDRLTNTRNEVWDFEKQYRGVQECDWNTNDLYRYKKQKAKLRCLEDGKEDCD